MLAPICSYVYLLFSKIIAFCWIQIIQRATPLLKCQILPVLANYWKSLLAKIACLKENGIDLEAFMWENAKRILEVQHQAQGINYLHWKTKWLIDFMIDKDIS